MKYLLPTVVGSLLAGYFGAMLWSTVQRSRRARARRREGRAPESAGWFT